MSSVSILILWDPLQSCLEPISEFSSSFSILEFPMGSGEAGAFVPRLLSCWLRGAPCDVSLPPNPPPPLTPLHGLVAPGAESLALRREAAILQETYLLKLQVKSGAGWGCRQGIDSVSSTHTRNTSMCSHV